MIHSTMYVSSTTMCPHNTICVSSYYFMFPHATWTLRRVRELLSVAGMGEGLILAGLVRVMCPDTTWRSRRERPSYIPGVLNFSITDSAIELMKSS